MIDGDNHRVNPKYLRQVQGSNLCFGTAVQMEFLRTGDLYDLEQLSNYLGVCISEEDKNKYVENFRALNKNHPEVGFLFSKLLEEETQEKFRALGREIEVRYPSQLEKMGVSYKDYILEGLDAEPESQGTILNIHWGKFRPRIKDGHYVLVNSYNETTRRLEVIDPSPRKRYRWDAPIEDFEDSQRPKWKERDGISRERGILRIRNLAKKPKILPKIIMPKDLSRIVEIHNEIEI